MQHKHKPQPESCWEIRNGHATCGTVVRLNSSGAPAVEAYRRESTPAPSGSTSGPSSTSGSTSGPGPGSTSGSTRHSTPAPDRSVFTPATVTPPAPDLQPGGVIQFMNH